jgi:hypothetical protein
MWSVVALDLIRTLEHIVTPPRNVVRQGGPPFSWQLVTSDLRRLLQIVWSGAIDSGMVGRRIQR